MARVHASRFVALLVGAALLGASAGLLGACSSQGGETAASAQPEQEPVVPEQEPAVAPTRGTGGDEAPLPEAQALPVLTTAAAGTGSGNLVAPDTVCLFWTWGGDGTPPLTDGLSFSVDHAVVVPETWSASRDACGDSSGVQWCDGAEITADASTCVLGFVRSATPSTEALVGMVGTLTCADWVSRDDCVTLLQTVDDAPDLSADLDLEAIAGAGG